MKKRDKRFLNESLDEYGYVAWSLRTKGDITYGNSVVEANLDIADCSKSIGLDFDCEKPRHIQKRIDKLDELLKSLQEFREALEEAKHETYRTKYYY